VESSYYIRVGFKEDQNGWGFSRGINFTIFNSNLLNEIYTFDDIITFLELQFEEHGLLTYDEVMIKDIIE
jgi:hypothetical protein